MIQSLFNQGLSLMSMYLAKSGKAQSVAQSEEGKKAEEARDSHKANAPKRMSDKYRQYHEQRAVDLSRAAYEANPTAENAAAHQEAMRAQQRSERRLEKQREMAREAQEASMAEQERLRWRREFMQGVT